MILSSTYLLEVNKMRHLKFIVERHPDCYIVYPLGVNGVVVGQGETSDEAVADAKSALACHIETFGARVLEI